MGTLNICLYKENHKKCTGCNLKNMELLDLALKGISVVIRLNMVSKAMHIIIFYEMINPGCAEPRYDLPLQTV